VKAKERGKVKKPNKPSDDIPPNVVAEVEESMAKEVGRTSISIPTSIAVAASLMTQEHKVGSFSEYVRGLILLDILIVRGEAKYVRRSEIPAWLLADFPPPLISLMRSKYLEAAKHSQNADTRNDVGISIESLSKL
jgi:hypothetical protein